MQLDNLYLYPSGWVDDDARSFATVARQWADQEIIGDRLAYRQDYARNFVEKRRSLSIDIGFQRLVLPEKHGGYGWNTPSSAPGILTVFNEIGRADAAIGLVTAIKYAVFATITMEPNLDSALCDALAPLYFADDIKTLALILPGPGHVGEETALFKGRAIGVRARRNKDGWKLNGANLRPFGFGGDADLLCVVCAREDGQAALAFVPADTEGVTRGPVLKETGLEASPNADFSFNGVDIPADHLITRSEALPELYTWLNLLVSGVCLGAAMNFHEILDDWAESRVIKGGAPMKDNPLCAGVLATVGEEIATARLLSYSLAHLAAKPESWGGVGSEGIYTFAQIIGRRVVASCLNALNRGMELMGSAGYAKEWHVEKHWRDIKTIQSHLCGVAAEVPVQMDAARHFFSCREV